MLVKHRQLSDVAAMKDLLARGVAVAPGTPFFADQAKPSGYLRIHFAISPETVAKVRDNLDRLARSNPKIEQRIRTYLRRLPAAHQRDPMLKGVFRWIPTPPRRGLSHHLPSGS